MIWANFSWLLYRELCIDMHRYFWVIASQTIHGLNHLKMFSNCSKMNFAVFCLVIFDAWTDILVVKRLKRTFIMQNETEATEADETEFYKVDLAKTGFYTENLKRKLGLNDPMLSVHQSDVRRPFFS